MVIRAYSSSFGLASRLLAEPVRTHVRNVYALVRVADEIVDNPDPALGPGRAPRCSTGSQDDVRHAMRTGYSGNLVVHAFARTPDPCGIERGRSSTRSSTRCGWTSRPRSTRRESFDRYVYGSAEVVGLMCLRAFLAGTRRRARSGYDAARARRAPARRRVPEAQLPPRPRRGPRRPAAATTSRGWRSTASATPTATASSTTSTPTSTRPPPSYRTLPASSRRAVRAAHATFAELGRPPAGRPRPPRSGAPASGSPTAVKLRHRRRRAVRRSLMTFAAPRPGRPPSAAGPGPAPRRRHRRRHRRPGHRRAARLPRATASTCWRRTTSSAAASAASSATASASTPAPRGTSCPRSSSTSSPCSARPPTPSSTCRCSTRATASSSRATTTRSTCAPTAPTTARCSSPLEPGAGERLRRLPASAEDTYDIALRRFLYSNFDSTSSFLRTDVVRRTPAAGPAADPVAGQPRRRPVLRQPAPPGARLSRGVPRLVADPGAEHVPPDEPPRPGRPGALPAGRLHPADRGHRRPRRAARGAAAHRRRRSPGSSPTQPSRGGVPT